MTETTDDDHAREQAQWIAYRLSGDPGIRTAMCLKYRPLSISLAVRFVEKLAKAGFRLNLDEAVQEAALGLLDAIERYDPEIGNRFITYAPHRIRGHLMDWLRRINGRTPRVEIFVCDPDDVTRQAGGALDPALTALDDAEEPRHILRSLSDRDRDLMIRHVIDGQTLKQCAAAHQISESRVSQIVAEVRERLRQNRPAA